MYSHNASQPGASQLKPEPFVFQQSAATSSGIPTRRLEAIPSRGAVFSRVLVVVSDPIECARVGRALCRLGHSVSLVCDARDAAAMLVNSLFNLVLIEIDPPGRAGRLAVEQLLPTLTIAVAVLSGTPEVEQALLGRKPQSVLAVIAKPASEESLRQLFSKQS